MGFNKAILVFLGVLLLGSGLVMAIRGATVTKVADLVRWTAVGSPGNTTTEGGNITMLNLNASSLTDRWAGFYGNLTGELYLTDNASGTTAYLFKWANALPTDTGEVCVSTGSAFNFLAAVAGTAADVDTLWGFGGVPDNATLTFTGTCNDFVFDEQGVTVTGAPAANHSNGGASTFATCAINDGSAAAKANLAFCVQTKAAGTTYNSETANYELMVPTPFASGSAGFQQYFFYAEVN